VGRYPLIFLIKGRTGNTEARPAPASLSGGATIIAVSRTYSGLSWSAVLCGCYTGVIRRHNCLNYCGDARNNGSHGKQNNPKAKIGPDNPTNKPNAPPYCSPGADADLVLIIGHYLVLHGIGWLVLEVLSCKEINVVGRAEIKSNDLTWPKASRQGPSRA
jgi:hypothetical protein